MEHSAAHIVGFLHKTPFCPLNKQPVFAHKKGASEDEAP